MEEDKIAKSVEDASESLSEASAEADVQGHAADDAEGDQDVNVTFTGGVCSG